MTTLKRIEARLAETASPKKGGPVKVGVRDSSDIQALAKSQKLGFKDCTLSKSGWDARAKETKRTQISIKGEGHMTSMGQYKLSTRSVAKNAGYRDRVIYISCMAFEGYPEFISAYISGIDDVWRPFKSVSALSLWVADLLSANPR